MSTDTRTSYTERMRLLLRAGVFGLVLVFGIPAAALLLAHLGLIGMPQDAYVSSVTEISPATSVEYLWPIHPSRDYARVLGPPDTLDTPRTVIARAAIREAAAHLPGHQEGVDRNWTFYRVSHPGFTYGARTATLRATAPVGCDGCAGEPEQVWVSARVVWVRSNRAEVAIDWALGPERRPIVRSRAKPGVDTERGKITITLELAADAWRATQIESRE